MLREAASNLETSRGSASVGHALIPIAAFALIVALGLWARPFQYDTDEGINLMKAAVLGQGYPLYTHVWSDQPPLYTYVLEVLFKWTGKSALAARVLSAGFSALLLVSLYDLVRRLVSTRAAIVASITLLASAWYLRLSFAVMIGLPALSLTTASLALLVRAMTADRSSRSWILLIASALMMSAAMAVKLFAMLVVPAALVLVWAVGIECEQRRARLAFKACVWLALLCATVLAITSLMKMPVDDLIGTHVTAASVHAWRASPAAHRLLRRDSDLTLMVLATLATLSLVPPRQRRISAIPLVWIGVVAIVLQFHRPVWYHHGLLLTIPAAWCAGMFVETLWQLRSHAWRWRFPIAVALIGLACFQAAKLVVGARRMFVADTASEQQLIAEMRRRAPQTRWAMSDRLMYPFAAGLVVPPEVAVMSTKRREAGKLSDELIIRVLKEYKPEQVVLARIAFGPAVDEYLRMHYRVARKFDLGRAAPLYVRRDE